MRCPRRKAENEDRREICKNCGTGFKTVSTSKMSSFIGTSSHTYDSGGNYTLKMIVDGHVNRTFDKTGGGTHTEDFMNYQKDEEETGVEL